MLATRFGINSFVTRQDTPLTDEQLFYVAPSIFAEDKHGSRSERYTYIPTIHILNGLRKEGFQPFMAAQSRSRIEGKQDFTKHMLRLRHADQITGSEVNEIILVNSHDGTSSYQMLAGVFRFVCHNGMVTGDTIEDIRIPHRGNITENVIEAAYSIVDDFDEVTLSIEEMKGAQLKPAESAIFAEAALALKYDESNPAPILPDRLLTSRRLDDRQDSVWHTFNRIQENLMKGGLRGHTASGNRTTTREIKSIDNNIKLNKALWILGSKMAELKS